MATIFQDIDGSFMEWGTEKPLPGALEKLSEFYAAGHQIIFTTQREENDPSFDMETLRSFMKTHFPTAIILYDITSPRIVFNDHGAIAINHPQDAPWTYDLLKMLENNKCKIMTDREWLMGKVNSISSHTLELACLKVIEDDRFFVSPAAARKHQAWTGGLAQHTKEVMGIALATASAEPLNGLVDVDIIIAGVLWHDYGKIWDYKKNEHGCYINENYEKEKAPEWVYDRHRWTIRHLSRSYAEFLIAAKEAGCPDLEIEEVSHCILSHHGRHEYGSPVTPLSVEAAIIHNSDSIDAFYVGKPHIFRTPRTNWEKP